MRGSYNVIVAKLVCTTPTYMLEFDPIWGKKYPRCFQAGITARSTHKEVCQIGREETSQNSR